MKMPKHDWAVVGIGQTKFSPQIRMVLVKLGGLIILFSNFFVF